MEHGYMTSSSCLFNFTILADPARPLRRVEIIFRLCNFYKPRPNIIGLFLRLARAYVDKATFDELGTDIWPGC